MLFSLYLAQRAIFMRSRRYGTNSGGWRSLSFRSFLIDVTQSNFFVPQLSIGSEAKNRVNPNVNRPLEETNFAALWTFVTASGFLSTAHGNASFFRSFRKNHRKDRRRAAEYIFLARCSSTGITTQNLIVGATLFAHTSFQLNSWNLARGGGTIDP
jgi:hypothetical protein